MLRYRESELVRRRLAFELVSHLSNSTRETTAFHVQQATRGRRGRMSMAAWQTQPGVARVFAVFVRECSAEHEEFLPVGHLDVRGERPRGKLGEADVLAVCFGTVERQ